MGASTRRRSAGATTASRKKADARLDDITNGKGMGGETTTSKGARPSRKSIGGPSTVAPVEKRVTRSSRSTAKKATETTTAKSTKAKNSAKVVVGLALEERFNDVVDDVPAGKKRKALGVIEEKQPKRETRARAAARKGDGVKKLEKKVPHEVIDLTCDERLVSDRGLALATSVGVSAQEDVYPFSIDGGRRITERNNKLAPYVKNGVLFSIGMRQELVDWMSQQHGTLDLVDETLHLALRYLDTFLVRRGTEQFLARNGAGSEPVPALPLPDLPEKQVMYLNDGEHQPLCNKLKRLGITCIFVAAKVTEVSAPSALEFAGAAEVSTFTRSQLLLAERALLRELEYNLYLPTASSFSSAYLSVTLPHLKKNGVVSNYEGDWDEDPCEEITEIVDYLLEASAVSHKSLDFAPSVAAAAAIGYVLSRVYGVSWERLSPLHALSGYGESDLHGVFGFFDKLVNDAYDTEEKGRGLHANDKYQNATSILWRKFFFS